MPPPGSVTRSSEHSGLALSTERTQNSTVCVPVSGAGEGRSEPGSEGRHVPFPGEPLVGLLDVGLAGAPADPQDAVRVEIPRRGLRSQGGQQQGGGPSQARPPQLHGSGGQRGPAEAPRAGDRR